MGEDHREALRVAHLQGMRAGLHSALSVSMATTNYAQWFDRGWRPKITPSAAVQMAATAIRQQIELIDAAIKLTRAPAEATGEGEEHAT